MEALRAKFDARLKSHIGEISLREFCRVNEARLEQTAIPNIGSIELVSGSDFARLYDSLYISSFPLRLERERSDLIVDRLQKEFAGERHNLAPYRVVGIRDHGGAAIGAAQFSVLNPKGTSYAVPYLQYIYVRSQSRRQDMAEVLHTMVLAVASADATKWDRIVLFTLFECEPTGYGSTEAARTKATQRVQIHARAGAVALMLRQEDSGRLRTPHVQPGLEPGDEYLSLLWAIREPPMAQQKMNFDINAIGRSLLGAYYQSVRDEGFPLSNIALAEHVAEKRCADCKFVIMPLAAVPPTVEGIVLN